MSIIQYLRGKLSGLKRRISRYLVQPARALVRLPEALARIAEIDRRVSQLPERISEVESAAIARHEHTDRRIAQFEAELGKILPWDHEFTRAGIELFGENIRTIRQKWTLSSTPFSSRLTLNTEAPVPPLTSRARIQGAKCVEQHPQDEHFLNSGLSDLRAVFNIAGLFGINVDQELSVLDFGVGCARMARQLPPNARTNFIGADVDTVNIAWCNQNMPFGRYEAILPGGTIPAPDRHFDLIYSHSVFTHLSPSEQDHWLKELGRVSKGLIILSVHGLYSSFLIASWSRDPKYLAKWLKEGFVDAGVPNPDISDVVDKEYYRDVAHTPCYIKSHWSNLLEVVEIIPGGFGSIHDAIVLRSKRG